MSDYNSTQDYFWFIIVGPIAILSIIGIQTDDGEMWFGWLWRLCGWMIQNGWFN